MRKFWQDIFPKKKQLELFVYLLGQEGTKLPYRNVCSCLNIQRTSLYNLCSSINTLIAKHNVPLQLSIIDGYVLLKKVVDVSKEEQDNTTDIINAIITYLNERTNKNYKTSSRNTRRLIEARIKEGYSYDDFKYVIDVKVQKWANSDMDAYLRPETLFSNKFQSYVNEQPKQEPISKIEQTINTINNPTDYDWGKGE